MKELFENINIVSRPEEDEKGYEIMKKTVVSIFCNFIIAAVVCGLSASDATAGSIQLEDTLHKKTAIFGSMHKKASRSLVNAAHDKVFLAYFNASSDAERKKLKGEIEQISLVVQKRFVVDEMCLIHSKGHMITRIVFDKIVDMSSSMKGMKGGQAMHHLQSPYFKPSFAKKDKEVHVQKPYMSPDSGRWVLAYTTPIVKKDGSKPAFLHYEMPVEKYQNEMAKGIKGQGDAFIVAVDKDGFSWVDSRHTYNLKGDPKTAKIADYFPKLEKELLGAIEHGKTGKGQFKQNGKSYSVAYKPAGYFDWTMAVVSAD